MKLELRNTLGGKRETFEPLNAGAPSLYACGPTVYDDPHVGNARPLIVFDVLFRTLRRLYGSGAIYARNLTDVDDKIYARADADGVSIDDVASRVIERFGEDCRALGLLAPTVEPRATEHVPSMIAMIERLLAAGHAYLEQGHVMFEVSSFADYGKLSGLSASAMRAGARVEVAPYKRSPLDFVLWKPSAPSRPGWESPWGRGRPGWHIECSAMAATYLGEQFDIHAGGEDLMFPHHENEIAQSRCAHGAPSMARFWLHNAYVRVGGEKMSKSLGNVLSLRSLREAWGGHAVRLAMLATHYRHPLDWSESRLLEAARTLLAWRKALGGEGAIAKRFKTLKRDDDLILGAPNRPPPPRASREAASALAALGMTPHESGARGASRRPRADGAVLEALCDDLNAPRAIAALHASARKARRGDDDAADALADGLHLLGLLDPKGVDVARLRSRLGSHEGAEAGAEEDADASAPPLASALLEAREAARRRKDFALADALREGLRSAGLAVIDSPHGQRLSSLRSEGADRARLEALAREFLGAEAER